MKNCKNYVGIDVSKLSFDVAISKGENNYCHYKLSNDEKGFSNLLKLLVKEENVCLVMEASGPYYLKIGNLFKRKRHSRLRCQSISDKAVLPNANVQNQNR